MCYKPIYDRMTNVITLGCSVDSICLHPRSEGNMHLSHSHSHTALTQPHSQSSEEVWSFGWMLQGDLTVCPIWISCKVHNTDKMAWTTCQGWLRQLRLLNQTLLMAPRVKAHARHESVRHKGFWLSLKPLWSVQSYVNKPHSTGKTCCINSYGRP